MNDLLYKTAIKYALIAIGVSLLGSLPLFLGGQSKLAVGISIGIGILNIFVTIGLYIAAILEFSRKRNHRATVGEVFSLVGIMFGIVFIVGIITAFALSSFLISRGDYADLKDNAGLAMASSVAAGGCMGFIWAIVGLQLAGIWRTLQKAGKEGWESIVPVYNYVVMAEVGKNPSWWGWMSLVPLANIVFIIIILNGISKAFGKDSGWTVGLIFLGFVFWPMLAWGDARYQHGNFEQDARLGMEDHLVE